MTKGLVIGKFYPPHKGHQFLIDTAKQNSDQVVVLVCDRKSETIPAGLRAEWLREVNPDVEVRVIENIGHDDDSQIWADYTMQVLGYAPDKVFTSEDYGHLYSKIMGSEHVLVDKARKIVPVSGTLIRSDPYKYWEYLLPGGKRYFAKRVCLVGAESTGTTTLSKDLANYYKTNWVPEFGRYHSIGKLFIEGEKWGSKEFEFIARTQNAWEDELAGLCNKILFCDTNSWATGIWHKRYMGYKSKKVSELAKDRKYDLYILTDVNIPFVQDGVRDGEHIRLNMHNEFMNEMKNEGFNFIVVSGSKQERLEKAVDEIRKIFASS